MDRVLVTGGRGFIGARLVRRLIAIGRPLTMTYRNAPPEVPNDADVKLVMVGNVGPDTDWQAALAGCSTVVHLAGVTPGTRRGEGEFVSVNELGTKRLAQQARESNVRLLVNLSSILALVDNTASGPVWDRFPSEAQSAYGRSKLAAERHLDLFAGEAGRVGISIRPPLVYAGDASGNWRLLQRLTASGLPLPFGSARNKRSFIAADNLVDAICRVVTAPHDRHRSGAYNVADDHPVDLMQVVRWLSQGMKRSPRLVPIPPALVEFGLGAIGKTAMARSLFGPLHVDVRGFRDSYQWSPPMTPQEGIVRSGLDFLRLRSNEEKL